MVEGVAQPLSWQEFIAWQNARREIVTPFEYDILAAMDDAYVAATNAELENARATLRDRHEAEATALASKGKGKRR